MDRREFLRGSTLAAGATLLQGAKPPGQSNSFILENDQLTWHLEVTPDGTGNIAFINKLSGRAQSLRQKQEIALVFAAAPRIEIPWWDYCATDSGSVAPDAEKGLQSGFHHLQKPDLAWKPVHNLAGGLNGRIYDGYGWFRHEFTLPPGARGKDLVFVAGGYDQQSWNEQWAYVNGHEIGHSSFSTHWRKPAEYVLRPSDTPYAALTFDGSSRDILAIRTRGYNFHFDSLSHEQLEGYVFRPFLFDQFISVGQPYRRVSSFALHEVARPTPHRIDLVLQNSEHGVTVKVHYELAGFVRKKWLEISNTSAHESLLLDVEIDDLETESALSEGGHGVPVFLGDDGFAAIAHPAGINQGMASRTRLWHCPGKKLKPGEIIRSQTSVIGVAPQGEALQQFHSFVLANSPRSQKKRVSIYTVFGINNQWGACSTLSDTEVLDCQRVVSGWREKGAALDYFTLDTGWPDNDGDLTDFAPICYPDGPGRLIENVRRIGMKFGLWFSASWGGWANGSYLPIQPSAIPDAGDSGAPPTTPPVASYRNGFPIGGGIGRQMCFASEPYFSVFRNAILHHVKDNQVRLLKFDSGNYYCNSALHNHLPGRYSTEAMSNRLIQLVNEARAASPGLFVMWYWGAGSPFWALHGDVISESGLFMEGSGTSQFPTLYYRDSVVLSLDQNAQFAKLIPPLNKDSLGVWVSQIRWANFMGKERWREALVMDLGRGSLVFPQLWGDPNLFSEDDIQFLARMIQLTRVNESVFLQPRKTFGNTWANEPYGYSFFDGSHGFVFCNNAHFTSRKLRLPLGKQIGLSAANGSPLRIVSHFPDQAQLPPEGSSPYQAGQTAEIWLRPFETALLEIGPDLSAPPSRRALAPAELSKLGQSLALNPIRTAPWMELVFADASRFQEAGMKPARQSYSSQLPELTGGRYLLAIAVTLMEGAHKYKYSPVVTEIVQLRVRLGGRDVQLMPVPDARHYGNTQHAGCSWVLYKIPVTAKHSQQPLQFALHAYLPEGVKPRTEAWLVHQWWDVESRPEADGYYGDAPS